MNGVDKSIPSASSMKLEAEKAKYTFDPTIYSTIRDEVIGVIKHATSLGNTCVQYAKEETYSCVLINVLSKLEENLRESGYVVTLGYEEKDVKLRTKYRFNITWA